MDNCLFSIVWDISINGKTLTPEDRKFLVTDWSIEELCDGSDTLTLTVSDPDFELINDNIFIEEATVTLKTYLVGDSSIVEFNGYISAIDLDFPENGAPKLTITCLDFATHRMNREKKKRTWENVTSADVVKKIAREYGLQCEVEQGYPFKLEETITQSNQTDIEFVESLAGKETYPFMCKVIDGVILYKKKGLLLTPVAAFTYRDYPHTIKSFSPRINKETVQEEINTGDINTDTKKKESSKASSKKTSTDSQGSPVSTSSSATGSKKKPSKGVKKFNPKTGEWEDS